jgi:glycosyl transferase family 25
MKIYIVNLPRCPERRENILRECARFDLEPEIFYGVDGPKLTETELRALVFAPERNMLGRAEVGCTLSHLGIYRDMVEKNIPLALILEDDSTFNQDPRPLLGELERQPTEAPEVYLLTSGGNRYIAGLKPKQAGAFKFYQGWYGKGAYGYVITRKAAANLLGFNTPVKCPGDWWKLFQTNDLIRLFVCEKEIIAPHHELGAAETSLLANDRAMTWGRARRKYVRHVRNQTPLFCRIKYFFFRLWHGFNLRLQ